MICGHCKHYYMAPDLSAHCRKTRQVVGYLMKKDCFEKIDMETTNETKVCERCGRSLPLSEFGRHHKTKDGYQPLCRECKAELAKETHRPKGSKTQDDDKPSPDVDKSTRDVDLRDVADDDIFTELQRRGYKGTLTHTVTL